jgi:thymidylate synthase (FAD)
MVDIIKPWAHIEGLPQNAQDGMEILRRLERAGRTCYKSEDKITDESAPKFVKGILKPDSSGTRHESVIEHEKVTVRIVCDRGVTHEIVRHRLVSFSQESTRYCDYHKAGEIQVIDPCFWPAEKEIPTEDISEFKRMHSLRLVWEQAMQQAEFSYNKLRELGARPEQARSVLPNSLKTEIVVTANLREWRLIFRLRTSKKAHPQMREIMIPLLKEFKEKIPVIFDDIMIEE